MQAHPMREIQRHINLDALAANFLILRKLVAQSEVAAVVKADCYGLGVDRIAPALGTAGCEAFYIATLEEGLQLRQLLPGASIFVLNGIATHPIERFIEARLMPVLNSSADMWRWISLIGCACMVGVWRFASIPKGRDLRGMSYITL